MDQTLWFGGNLLRRPRRAISQRTQNRDGKLVSHSWLDPDSHKQMGLIVDMAVQFLHDNLDFAKRYIGTTADMHNRVKRLLKQFTAVHQRIFQCSSQSIVRTIFSLSISKTKQCASIAIS